MVHILKKHIKRLLLSQMGVNVDSKSTVKLPPRGTKFKKVVSIINSSISDVTFGEGCKFFNATCYGNITVGRFVSIFGPGTVMSSIKSKISIGSFSSIAQNVNIQDSYHRWDKVSTYFMSRNIFGESIDNDTTSKGDITIGEDVWIGANVVILSGVAIGRGSIIGAGTIVTKNIPAYSIVVGNPGKVIKKRFSDEICSYLDNLEWWNWSIDRIIANKDFMNCDLNNIKLPYTNIK
jgi:virginiamycin A acetyltransferase